MAIMKQITRVMMQSKSKVGTRNVRVRIERNLGVVLSVEFNGKPLIDAVSKASESVDKLSQGFEGLAKTVVMNAAPGLRYALDAMVKEQAAQIEGEKLLATLGKSSNGIEDEVDYFNQRSRLLNANGVFGAHKSPYKVDRQDLIDDDFSSLAMRRLTRYDPVVMYDELGRYHDHQWHTVKFSTHTQSGFEDEYVEQCKICGVKKDENN